MCADGAPSAKAEDNLAITEADLERQSRTVSDLERTVSLENRVQLMMA